jgi:flagellar basal-body rod modification protein FlgD
VDEIMAEVKATQQAAGSASSPLGGLAGPSGAMGRDAFLKLLVAQLRNQDPLKPQDSSQFVAELAQFSSLEQSMAINDRLDMISIQNQGLANTQITTLVGKVATVRGTMVTNPGTGIGVPVNFTLGADASEVTITVRNQAGQIVRTIDMGDKKAGLANVQWDGRNDDGVVQPAGAYSVAISAKDDGDNTITVAQETTSTVESVSFDQGYPVLHLANGVSVPVSDLLKVEQSKP